MVRVRWALATLAALATGLVVSCALDLDESRIGVASDGGDGDRQPGDGDAGGGDGDGGGAPDTSSCTRDDECTTTHGCLKGRCDLSRKACVYDVCKVSVCTVKTCDKATKTCGGADALYKYKAAQFSVGAQISTGRGFAAVYPYLFILTSGGVVAFNVSNPANTTPPKVDVAGLGFVPYQIVGSGSRVYFIGNPNGSPTRMPIAWIDVPADPLADKLVVKSALATANRPEAPTLFAASEDSALLVGPASQSHPSALVKAPLNEPLAITATPIPFTDGTYPVIASGSRLVMQSVNGAGVASFGFINGAGSASPTNAGNVAMTDAGHLAGPQGFSQSADGAVLWTIAALTGPIQPVPPPPNPPPPQPTVRAARAIFVVPNAAGAFDPAAGVDVETYAPGTVSREQSVVGPTAMLDANTALVVTAAKENVAQSTAVQFVRRNPLEVVKDGANARRQVLPITLGSMVAAAGSNGFGYVIATEPGPPANATVYIFDPGCAL